MLLNCFFTKVFWLISDYDCLIVIELFDLLTSNFELYMYAEVFFTIFSCAFLHAFFYSQSIHTDTCDAMAKALYDRLFTWIITSINMLLSSSASSHSNQEKEICKCYIFINTIVILKNSEN